MHAREKYPLIWWRPIFDILFCYALIFVSIRISLLSIYFYPVTIFILANRILALSLICHEAIHGSLFHNHKLNNFVGRWFCAFPTCISFSKYRKLHLLHHRALGNHSYDPDYHLYKDYPQDILTYFKKNLIEVLTFVTIRKFIDYYTEINDFIFSKEKFLIKIKKNRMNGDFIEFCTFYLVLFSVLFYTENFHYYIVFFSIPLFLITQPYVLFMGGLQHGPVQKSQDLLLLSRSVRGNKFFMEAVLPLDINYHSEHHFNAAIPHYWLRKFSEELEKDRKDMWTSDYSQAVAPLFGQK